MKLVIPNLGPFAITEVTETMRAMVVSTQTPVIVEEGGSYAVLLPPTKKVRVLCAGCFRVGATSLSDKSKCKTICTFSQHLKTKKDNGERIAPCTEAAGTTDDVELEINNGNNPSPTLDALSDLALAQELVRRAKENDNLYGTVFGEFPRDRQEKALIDCGFKLLYGAKPADLAHEYRRVRHAMQPTREQYYDGQKQGDQPHVDDYPGPDLPNVNDINRNTEKKRRKKRESEGQPIAKKTRGNLKKKDS